MDGNLSADLLSLLKSGKIMVHQDDTKLIEVDAKDSNITVNIVNLLNEITTSGHAFAKISEARRLAGLLDKRGITLTLSRDNKPVVKLGRDAKPKLSRLVTQSSNVEVTNLRELRHLDRRLRTS